MNKLSKTIIAIALTNAIYAPSTLAASPFNTVLLDNNGVGYNSEKWSNCDDNYSGEEYTGWQTLHTLRQNSSYNGKLAYFAYCNDGAAYQVYELNAIVNYYDGGSSINEFGQPIYYGDSKTIKKEFVDFTDLKYDTYIESGKGIKGVITMPDGSTSFKLAYNIEWGDNKSCSDDAGAKQHHMADGHILIGKSKGTSLDNNGCKNKKSIPVNIHDSGAIRLNNNNAQCITQMGPTPILTECTTGVNAQLTQQMVHDTHTKQLTLAYGLENCLTAMTNNSVQFASCAMAGSNASWEFANNQYESVAYPGMCLSEAFGQLRLASCNSLTDSNGHWDFVKP